MSENKIVGKVFQTSNYELFKHRKDNRPVKETNVLHKMASIQQMGQRQPISVDTLFRVTDGQHRLEACKRLNIPVIYIMDDRKMSTHDIADLQSSTKGWTVADYTHSYAQKDHNYKTYKEFVEKYPQFSHHTCLVMLSGKTKVSGLEASFKAGSFEIKSLARARDIADKLIEMGQYYPGYFKRGYVMAFIEMYVNPEFDYERLCRKMPKRCKDIMDFSRTEDYLDTLQSMYNWKETKKVYFH